MLKIPKLWDIFVWGVAASVGLVGCVNSAQHQLIPPPTEPPGESRIQELEPFEENPESTLPRKLEVSLTLSSPDDLRVKPGQEIKAGQVLSDRSEERKRLEKRRSLLEISLKSLNLKPQPPAPLQPIPLIPELPPADFSREEASVNKAALVMQQSSQTIVQQQEKIIAFREIPNIPEAIIEHEQAKLRKLEDQLKLIQADYQQAIAILKNAQASRYQQEYQHQLEVSKRLLDVQAQQLWAERAQAEYASRVQDLEYQKASVLTQLQGIDEQLEEVTAVTSPYDGKVRKIKHDHQNNRHMVVTVVLDIERGTSDISRIIPGIEQDQQKLALSEQHAGMYQQVDFPGSTKLTGNSQLGRAVSPGQPNYLTSEIKTLDFVVQSQPDSSCSESPGWRRSPDCGIENRPVGIEQIRADQKVGRIGRRSSEGVNFIDPGLRTHWQSIKAYPIRGSPTQQQVGSSGLGISPGQWNYYPDDWVVATN